LKKENEKHSNKSNEQEDWQAKVEKNYDPGYCIPHCSICGGLGFVKENPDAGIHDEGFGKLIACPNRRFKYWDDGIGISFEEAKVLNWEDYLQTKAVTDMRQVYDAVLERGFGWAYFYGNPGNGKTIMAKSSVVYASQVLGYKAKYTKVSTLINDLRASYSEDAGQKIYFDKLQSLRKVKYLVLDEVGRDRQTDFSKQSLSDIMDYRYEDAVSQQTVTVWVSNFKPEDIFEPYQFDRIRDGRFNVLEINDVSNRPTMRYKQPEKAMWWHDY
jgi:DNA replication protein DnaC